MEQYWDTIVIITEIVNVMITGYLIGYYVKPYMGENTWKSCGISLKRLKAGAGSPHQRYGAEKNRKCLAVTISYIAVMLILYFCPIYVDSALAYGVGILVTLTTMVCVDHRNYPQKLFLALTAYLMRWIASGLMVMIWTPIGMKIGSAEMSETFRNVWPIVLPAVGEIISAAILFGLIAGLNKAYTRKLEEVSRTELILLITPVFSNVVGYWVLHYLGLSYEKVSGVLPQENSMDYRLLLSGYQIICYFALLVVVLMFQRIKKTQEEKYLTAIQEGQIAEIRARVEEAEGFYQSIRGLRHDMNQHLQIICALLDQNKYEEAAGYLSRIDKETEALAPDVKTGNPVTDVILSEKKKEAEEKGILFESSFQFPQDSKADAFDISVILINALTNAMEGAQKSTEKMIFVTSKRKNHTFLIDVVNSFEGELKIDPDTGLPETSKEEGDHGLGFLNIRRVAEKYYGTAKLTREDDRVRLTAMMII